MSQVKVEKISDTSKRSLPIFAEFLVHTQGARGGREFPTPVGLDRVRIHRDSGLRAGLTREEGDSEREHRRPGKAGHEGVRCQIGRSGRDPRYPTLVRVGTGIARKTCRLSRAI